MSCPSLHPQTGCGASTISSVSSVGRDSVPAAGANVVADILSSAEGGFSPSASAAAVGQTPGSEQEKGTIPTSSTTQEVGEPVQESGSPALAGGVREGDAQLAPSAAHNNADPDPAAHNASLRSQSDSESSVSPGAESGSSESSCLHDASGVGCGVCGSCAATAQAAGKPSLRHITLTTSDLDITTAGSGLSGSHCADVAPSGGSTSQQVPRAESQPHAQSESNAAVGSVVREPNVGASVNTDSAGGQQALSTPSSRAPSLSLQNPGSRPAPFSSGKNTGNNSRCCVLGSAQLCEVCKRCLLYTSPSPRD